MSDSEEVTTKPLAIERAKQGRAKCQKCKNKIDAGELRLAKLNFNNPFGSGPLKQWFHIDCFCETKANKQKISLSCANDIDGWDIISAADREHAIKVFGPEFKASTDLHLPSSTSKSMKDNLFSEFNRLIDKIAGEPSYNNKSAIIQKYLREGSNNKKFEGNLEIWLKLLVPKVDHRVYNLQDKQIVKLFSRIFSLKHDDLLKDLQAGDVSETISKFFESSRNIKPIDKSSLTVMDIDKFLDELSTRTLENDQIEVFEEICKKSTTDDIRTLIRLIKKDLKMNCRERHVLDAIHHDAYDSFQKSRNLNNIIKQYGSNLGATSKSTTSSTKLSGLQVMTPISPMLAEACKDFDKALSKCRDGFYSEVKYDGERVQIHKKGNDFKFFSRNLKPVQEHKIGKIKEYLPKAFPNASDLILDSEIIMVDTITGNLLPFGTLGKHKKNELQNASACLFIFDCLYFNGDDLTKKTLKDRKKFLESNMQPIKHHIELSEYKLLTKKNELIEMTKEVLKKGLEGLVLKGLETIYEPGKRRWLKVKKDYLLEGSIADSADLVVLGAFYGTGKMGNRFSIFLMGCYDEKSKIWKTVTKVHSGLDDATMEKMHNQISPLMEPFNSNKKLPQWIQIDRSLIPDALTIDPFKMPVFEIVAAEFTNSDVHTANSISMRFPRITKIRNDKSPKEATTLDELTHLYEESKAGLNIDELNKLKSNSDDIDTNKKSLVTKTASSSSMTSKITSMEAMKRKVDDNKRCDKGNDEEVPSKKIKSRNSESSNLTSENLFEGFVLFDTDNLIATEIDGFKKYGGKVTKKSIKANLVLYDGREVQGSLDDMRELYVPSCRHYQKSWLVDSLAKKKVMEPLKYFVELRQS
ncbi:DNA ligase 3 [Chironomus tepperi]|uniref:DNA ligase 3 n=1 Tax=Chironomus tepperi TaxID=113505 RepID=UPI00391F15C2